MQVYLSVFIYDVDSPLQVLLVSFPKASFPADTIGSALLAQLEAKSNQANPFTQHLSERPYYDYGLPSDFKPTTKEDRLAEVFAGSIAVDVLKKEMDGWMATGDVVFSDKSRIDEVIENPNWKPYCGIQLAYAKRVLFSDSFEGLE